MFEDGAGGDEVAAILRLGHAGTLPKGVRLVTQFGEIVTIRTTRSNILNVSAAPEVADIAAGDTYLGPDVEAAEATDYAEISSDTALDTDERRPLDEKATGRGVVIGLVDWGFDFAHPDFLKPDGTSRILAIWDQRGSKRPNSPQPFGYGVVHDQSAINRALKQVDPYSALGYHPADADTGIGSHGTHVLSIAAGSGGEERPVGVAPEADLVVVHNAPWDEIDTGRLGDSVTLLEGVDFIARLAGDRPWVVNLSMGKHGEQHDGSTLIEQGLDAAIRSSAGRAVCLSAGNYFDKRIHASGQLRPTQERTLIWEIQENKPTNNQLEFWYSWQDKFEVRVKSPDGSISARAAIGDRSKFLVGGKEVGNVYHRGQEPNNLDNHIVIYLYKDAPTGEWEVTLTGEDVIDGRYHAWIERDVSCSRCQSRLREADADPHCTTGTICNGRRTLAVGAYNKHDPEMRLAHFSSVGPTRDGRLKPDLCAPGVAILAARSAPREKRDPPQLCTRMSGTSMAAPCVTGTIALMFQAAPRLLRIEETHNILLQSARKVAVPEEIPERLGIGFLDIEEAVDAARKLPPLVSSFKQTTVHSTPPEKSKNQTREGKAATSTAVASEGFSPGAALAVALSLGGGTMGGSNPDSEAEVISEVAPFSFEENYRAPAAQTARAAGAEWAELADDIVADVGESHSEKVLHEMFERSDDLGDLGTDALGKALSAAQIFDALVYPGNPKLRQQLTQNFQVVALPEEPVDGKVRAGDIMVRRTDGVGGHIAIVAAPGLKSLASLSAEGLVAESNSPGQYVQVIEGGGDFAHESEDKYARQLADGFGRVLNDVVLLRLASPTQSVVTVNQSAPAAAPAKDPDAGDSAAEAEIFNDNDLRYDMTELPPVQTRHQVMVERTPLKYTATAGRLPIKSGDGQTRAQMFYVAYTLDGPDPAKRPLTFLFNGGPGSASLWLHMGAMGPRKVALQPEGFLPAAPYHFESNPSTLLDKSDLVFVDAIGTGFSRAADSRSFGYFWGVRGDIEAFSEFIRLFITRNERWASPLFLFGESYGTLRAAGIAGYLAGKGISFNGITLLSTVLNYQTLEATKTNDQPYVFLIPTYTMIAGYHHKLPADLGSDMNRARREAEQWASSDYARALAKGDALTVAERQQAIEQMARYTGLGKDVIDEANLRIDVRKFTHYLLLDKKLRVGRFDGRFTGTDPEGLLDTEYYDPTEAATHPPFTSVFNNYVRSELGYKTDMPYYTRAQDADAGSWNWGSAIDGFPDTATALREAMVKNPYLKILVMEGFYDLATPFSAANYTVDHLDLPGRHRDNISVATYEAGHMVYLPEAGLKKMKADEAEFVARSLAREKQTTTESSENGDASESGASSLLLALNGVSLKSIGDGFLGQVPQDTQAAILAAGETDANALANMAFWQKHPELAGKKLDEKDPAEASLRREWSNLFFRGVRPLIWLRAMIDELDKYRGNIPREFLLGWIAWESDGDLKSTTPLGELGYFQIMWQSGEAKEQIHMTLEEFPKLGTDPDFSVAKGVALAQAYRDYISKNYPDITANSDLQLRLTKGRHAASGFLRNALRKLEKASTPITWASVSKALPEWMVNNIGSTMNYAAKLKPLADLVPINTKTGHESITEQATEDDTSRQHDQLTMELPRQPSRCTGVMTFYERPTYQLFLNDVKRVVRTCVQEGRENELLDNNDSLVSAWNELQIQPVSMALGEAKKIQVVPRYDWERTSGPPYWRATRITFLVQRKKTPAPPIPSVEVPGNKKDPPQPPIPPPAPPCQEGKDCRPSPPKPIEFDTWYYCTESGVKSVKAVKGHAPPAQADALTGFYQSNVAARLECFKHQKNVIDPPPGGSGPSGISDALRNLKSVMPLFFLFGSVAFFGEADFLMESMIEVYELAEALKAVRPGEYQFELTKDGRRLSVNVIRNQIPRDLQTFIEDLKHSGDIGQYEYDYLKSLANDVEIKMQNLDGARSLGFARQRGTWVRGQFIEDIYIQEKLRSQGYVGLPGWFEGYDAYKEGARFDPPEFKAGKYVTTFYDPDLISIKSYEPQSGLKNIDLDYLDKKMDEWIKDMSGNEFEKGKVRIVLSSNKKQGATRKNEIHLVVLGDEDISQFRDKLQGLAQLAAKKRISLKVIQYVKSTTRFTSLL
jgi:carboxypeptidase C (cathepsin A)/subtilisin family serine protease